MGARITGIESGIEPIRMGIFFLIKLVNRSQLYHIFCCDQELGTKKGDLFMAAPEKTNGDRQKGATN